MAEPVRASVVGAGRPVSFRRPATTVSRTVVAVRTPPAPQRPIEQRQQQSGGHLNEQSLVRPVGPARTPESERMPAQNGFRPFSQPNANNQVRQMPNTQPRTFEAQGNPQENQPNRNYQPQSEMRPAPNEEQRPAPQSQMRPSPHPLVRPAPPVQERTPQQEQQQEQKFNQWHQQERSSPPPRQQSRPAPQSKPEHSSSKK